MAATDPVALTQALIRVPSVTPEDAGALGVLETALTPLGFLCHRLRFDDANTPSIDNLYARLGTGGPNFCFAGHTDVVPRNLNQVIDDHTDAAGATRQNSDCSGS